MKCTDTKCQVEVSDDPNSDVHHKCQNSYGEHLNNVDIELVQMASGKIRVYVHAIIDDPKEGAPYEETGRELLMMATKALDVTLANTEKHVQSWWDIQSNGWGGSSTYLRHYHSRLHDFIRAAAEAGLAIVGSAEEND